MPELDFLSLVAGKLLVLMLAVALHESAHAYVGHWLGDDTPKKHGRVTLNPWPHLHPIMSILLPAVLLYMNQGFIFGAGRPVPITLDKLRHPSRDFALVALAGPATNIVLAVLFTGAYVLLRRGDEPILELSSIVAQCFRFGIMLNVLLAFFNMIPVPPLDGSRIVAYLLPGPLKRFWYSLDPIGFVILVVLFFTGMLRWILERTYYPVFNWWQDIYTGWM